MYRDNKRLYREIKRIVKKDGNRSRRRYLKKILIDNPQEAHLEEDYKYEFNSSKSLNGIDTKNYFT